jgi:hypothetical protein
MFLLDQEDDLYRLPSARFDKMLRDPNCHSYPRFAAARLRMADMVVEILDRHPIRVVWSTFGVLAFDQEGYFDPNAFDVHQRARAELALAPKITKPDGQMTVVDAATRFVARGGCWTPSRSLARRLDEAALGRVDYVRL